MKLLKCLDECILIKSLENADKMYNSNNFPIRDFRNDIIDEQIDKISKKLDKLKIKIEEFTQKTGSYWDKFKNYLYNDSFWSFRHMKADLIFRYNCDELLIQTPNKNNLECLLFHSKKNASNNTINSNTNTNNSINNTNQIKKKNLMIICSQNGAPLEYFFNSDRIIEFYLNHNVCVVLWNYQGYGYSTGTSSISVIITILTILEY